MVVLWWQTATVAELWRRQPMAETMAVLRQSMVPQCPVVVCGGALAVGGDAPGCFIYIVLNFLILLFWKKLLLKIVLVKV